MSFQINYGATSIIIPVSSLKSETIKPTNKSLRMWNSSVVKPIGECKVKLKNPKTKKRYSVSFFVVGNEQLTPIIGKRAAEKWI